MIVTEDEARAYVAGLTDAEGMARLEQFAALVLAENQQQNLIAKATEPHLWQRHIADSAQLTQNVSRETFGANAGGPWLDLGSGPGFPGLVIAALHPNMPVVLVESRARRVEFLNRAIEALRLPKCRVDSPPAPFRHAPSRRSPNFSNYPHPSPQGPRPTCCPRGVRRRRNWRRSSLRFGQCFT